jgi:hypothetical protein
MARLRQEHGGARQWINNLLWEVEKEREPKIETENVSAGLLCTSVNSGQGSRP